MKNEYSCNQSSCFYRRIFHVWQLKLLEKEEGTSQWQMEYQA